MKKMRVWGIVLLITLLSVFVLAGTSFAQQKVLKWVAKDEVVEEILPVPGTGQTVARVIKGEGLDLVDRLDDWRVTTGDDFRIVTINGMTAVESPNEGNWVYLYFVVTDEELSNLPEGSAVNVKVTYWDMQKLERNFIIGYDSHATPEGAMTPSDFVETQGGNKLVEAVVTLTNVRFGKKAHGDCDIRIAFYPTMFFPNMKIVSVEVWLAE